LFETHLVANEEKHERREGGYASAMWLFLLCQVVNLWVLSWRTYWNPVRAKVAEPSSYEPG
jgi:hypothetical protein